MQYSIVAAEFIALDSGFNDRGIASAYYELHAIKALPCLLLVHLRITEWAKHNIRCLWLGLGLEKG